MPKPYTRFLPLGLAVAAVVCFGESRLHAQRISVNADDYQQTFLGVGSSIPLYLNSHFNLDAAGQAEALDLIVRDLDLYSLQDYPEFRLDDPRAQNGYYTRRVEYLRAAKAIRPDLKLSQTFSIFPDDLRRDTMIGNRTERRLDFRRAGIYDAVAGWYFETLKFYHDNGLPIDIVNAVNEPDFITLRYGYGDDARRGTAEIFDRAISKMKAMIDDPAVNTTGVKQPLIMGPSTIGPGGAVQFVQYYKTEAPAAWANIDIVSYHQYTGGVSSALQSITRLADGKPVYQSEMHTNRGDDLPDLPNLTKGHRGILSLARTMGASMNAGVNAWYYFLNLFPGADTNPGLLQVDASTTRPLPFRHYYAFKQMGSAQPMGSRVLTQRLASIRADGQVTSLRREGSDTVYVHYANFTAGDRVVELEVLRADGTAYPIRQISQRVSDATRDDVDDGFVAVDPASAASRTITAGPYSLNTFTVVIGGTSGLSPKPAPAAPFTVYRSGAELVVTLDEGTSTEALRLTDAGGRVLEQRGVAPGLTTVRFAPEGLAPGVYLVSVRVARGWATRRVVWQ